MNVPTTWTHPTWNDDERDPMFRSVHANNKNKDVYNDCSYVPIWKVIKEMYDEDKEAMYCVNRKDPLNVNVTLDADTYYDVDYVSENDTSSIMESDSEDYCDIDSEIIDSDDNDEDSVLEAEIYKKYYYI